MALLYIAGHSHTYCKAATDKKHDTAHKTNKILYSEYQDMLGSSGQLQITHTAHIKCIHKRQHPLLACSQLMGSHFHVAS